MLVFFPIQRLCRKFISESDGRYRVPLVLGGVMEAAPLGATRKLRQAREEADIE